MANVLRKLSVEDLNAFHLMLWKGAETQLDIARWAEKRGIKIGKSDAAKCMVISRYSKGEKFQKWAENFESGNKGLMEKLALQKQRLDILKTLVADPDAGGMDAISKSLQARLLTLAAEASDEELVEGAAKNGWIKNVIRVIQEQSKLETRTAAESLKTGLQDVAGKDGKVSIEQVNERVDRLMGLKK